MTPSSRTILSAGGADTGSISYALPAGFNRGVITIGMSYPAAGCHGTVTVGDLILFDNNGGGDVLKLEFMYQHPLTMFQIENEPLDDHLPQFGGFAQSSKDKKDLE